MSDVFNRESANFGGSFAADRARMTFSGFGDATGTLVQSLSVNYQQSINRLYEIGSSKIYFIGGRTQGNGQLGRIIGPVKLTTQFYKTFGDLCKLGSGNAVTFDFSQECGSGNVSIAYTCKQLLIVGVGFSMTSQDMMISESVSFMFNSLNVG